MRSIPKLLWALLPFVLVACGDGKPAEIETPDTAESPAVGATGGVPDSDGNVPFEVFRRAVELANAGDFAGAERYILPNSTMGTTEGGKNVMPEKWPRLTHGGSISKIEFVGDSYSGFDAYVQYRLHYKDGTTFAERASLTKHEGRWKLTFMTETAAF